VLTQSVSTRPDHEVIEEIVYKLVSLCVTLNEYPHVRYNQNSVVGVRIATLLQDALNVSDDDDHNDDDDDDDDYDYGDDVLVVVDDEMLEEVRMVERSERR
jgi:hypothetical protein